MGETEKQMNLLKIEKFLCCFSLRAGTLTILWSTALLCFFSFMIAAGFERVLYDGDAFLLSLLMVLFGIGGLSSMLCLKYFPAPNKTYPPGSRSAKFLKYFALYYGVWACIFPLVFCCLTIWLATDSRKSQLPSLFPNAIVQLLLTAVSVHFMAVIHSFRLSILSPTEDQLDSIRNDVNACADEKNWLAMSTKNCLRSTEVSISKLLPKEPVAGTSMNNNKIMEIL